MAHMNDSSSRNPFTEDSALTRIADTSDATEDSALARIVSNSDITVALCEVAEETELCRYRKAIDADKVRYLYENRFPNFSYDSYEIPYDMKRDHHKRCILIYRLWKNTTHSEKDPTRTVSQMEMIYHQGILDMMASDRKREREYQTRRYGTIFYD
jgi:hypothetical protein